jgi:acetyl esterase/lipase
MPGQLVARSRLLALGLLAALAFAACNKDDYEDDVEPGLIQPTTSAPSYAPTIDPQMLAVLEQYIGFGTPSLFDLTPRQARMAPSVTDAVETTLRKNNRQASEANVTVSQRLVPAFYTPQSAPDGILVRIYKPNGVTGTLPAIVYYHGGGWVIGSLDAYEPSAEALAQNTGAIVVSVDYRLAPESKFPAAHEDCYAAYKWVRDNAESLSVNPAKVAVAGESAGGNMAAGVCILARERSYVLPNHQLLVYPVANNDLNTASYNQYAAAQPLNRANVVYFTNNYFTSMADGDNRLISLADVADLHGLPAATIIAAEIDPLQTEGAQLRDRFQQAGVPVTYQLYPGTTHEFFGTYDVVPKAGEAQTLAANQLKAAFH